MANSKAARNAQSVNVLNDLKTINSESLFGPGNIVISGGETTDHNTLLNRDTADQHPLEAITGLVSALLSKLDIAVVGVANGVATLDINGKVPLSQINDAILGQVEFKGLWDANANTPILPTSPTSNEEGHYYIVSTSGTQFSINFAVGDWIIASGNTWYKVDNTDAVSTVNGKVGVVVIDKADVGLANVDNTSDVNKPISVLQQAALDLKANKNVTARVITGADTPTSADLNKKIRSNSASAHNITISDALNASAAVDDVILFQWRGAGTPSFVVSGGQTINDGVVTIPMTQRYQLAVLEKVANNTWVLSGAI